jgi:hypothetical protein
MLRFYLTMLAFLCALPAQALTAVGTETLLQNFFGVNLHLSNCCNGHYEDTAQVVSHINYIGARRLRDWVTPQEGLLQRWQAVQRGTGAQFYASIPSTSPAGQRQSLAVMRGWLNRAPNLLAAIEGGNEEDMGYAVNLGATLADTAKLQHEVYAAGRKFGVPVVQMSVGAGWFPPLYEGNYKQFGKPPADLGNAHVYMTHLQPPIIVLERIGKLAAWSVNNKPVAVTEFGVYQSPVQTDAEVSAFMHIAPFTSHLLGHAGLWVYALHDDSSGVVGFYTAAGDKRPMAEYWHVTTRLLADPKGKNLPPKPIELRFTDQAYPDEGIYGIKNVPLYKADGSLWLATYNEHKMTAADNAQTIHLPAPVPVITVLDARNGKVVQTLKNTASVTVTLPPNHLFFVVAGKTAPKVPRFEAADTTNAVITDPAIGDTP